MKFLRNHWLALTFLVTAILIVYVTSNRAMVFGGYEGMFYHSAMPFLDDSPDRIEGYMTIGMEGTPMVNDVMMPGVHIQGTVDLPRNQVFLTAVMVVDGMEKNFGELTFEIEGDCLSFVLNEEEIWSEVLENQGGQNDRGQRIFRQITQEWQIEDYRGRDLRKDNVLVETYLTGYSLDLLTLLSEAQKMELQELAGMTTGQEARLMMIYEVDAKGDFTGLRLKSQNLGVELDGWIATVVD